MDFEFSQFSSPNFFTKRGAELKYAQLKKRGFPNFKNWRFLTLTIDPENFLSPEDAYIAGKNKLRVFIFRVRKVFNIKRYCWKLEFHQNGFPHWHLLLEYKKKIDFDFFAERWGLGRINCQRVNNSEMNYLFKYISKSCDDIPQWVLSLTHIRLFQTSPHFFTNKDDKENEPSSRPLQSPEEKHKSERQRETIAERLERWGKSLLVKSLLDGKYRVVKTEKSWGSFLVEICTVTTSENFKISNSAQKITLKKEIIWKMPSQIAFPLGYSPVCGSLVA